MRGLARRPGPGGPPSVADSVSDRWHPTTDESARRSLRGAVTFVPLSAVDGAGAGPVDLEDAAGLEPDASVNSGLRAPLLPRGGPDRDSSAAAAAAGAGAASPAASAAPAAAAAAAPASGAAPEPGMELFWAVYAGNLAAVRRELDAGAPVDAVDHDSDSGRELTALMLACQRGHEDIARLLLERGAYVNARDERGFTALLQAAFGGREGTTRGTMGAL
eukprot:tig00020629_g12427.t1